MPDIREMTSAEYHLAKGLSSGAIKTFSKDGPLVYHARYVARTLSDPDSDAKRLGRAFHLAMAHWPDWKVAVGVVPDRLADGPELAKVREFWGDRTKESMEPGTPVNRKSPAHRDWIQELRIVAHLAGLESVSEGESATLAAMVNSVMDNSKTRELAAHPQRRCELACFNTHRTTGLTLKALADIHIGGDLIVDFKTTAAMNPDEFIRESIRQRSYHYQAEWYLRVFGAKHFIFISVRNEPPWEAMAYYVPKEAINDAKESNERCVEAIHSFMQLDAVNAAPWHSEGWNAVLPLAEDHRELLERGWECPIM